MLQSLVERAWFMTTGTLGGAARAFAFGLDGPLGGLWPVRLPIAVLALEETNGAVTLVDAGWSAAQCASPARAMGAIPAAFLGVSTVRGDSIVEQLAARGVDRARVVRIVTTHLHDDHVGGVADFPDAELVTTRDELDGAHAARELQGFVAVHGGLLDRARCVSVDSDALSEVVEVARSSPDFKLARVDLRGHTAGAIGVVARVGQTVIVHLGDSAYTIREARRGAPSPLARTTSWNHAHQKRAYEEIAKVLDGDAIVVTSHDPGAYRAVDGRTFTRGSASL